MDEHTASELAYKKGYEQGKQDAMKWIPVAERLPVENDYYLCCVKSFLHPSRTYINILNCDKDGFIEGHIYTDDVTHWMPLPTPPKGE
jgi:hypothetical protein